MDFKVIKPHFPISTIILLERARYYQLSKDKESTEFLIKDSPSGGAPYNEMKDFNSGKSKLSIIDQFMGNFPYAMNYDTCFFGNIIFNYHPSILLDSHVSYYLHAVINKYNLASEDIWKSTFNFIKHMTTKGYRYNPSFYIIESLVKNSYDEFWLHTPPVIESIFRIQAIDCAESLINSDIKYNSEKRDKLLASYGATSFEEASFICAENHCIPNIPDPTALTGSVSTRGVIGGKASSP